MYGFRAFFRWQFSQCNPNKLKNSSAVLASRITDNPRDIVRQVKLPYNFFLQFDIFFGDGTTFLHITSIAFGSHNLSPYSA
jgi:hypothetical protein